MRQTNILILFIKFLKTDDVALDKITTFFYNKEIPEHSDMKYIFQELTLYEWGPHNINLEKFDEVMILYSDMSPHSLKFTWMYEPLSDVFKI